MSLLFASWHCLELVCRLMALHPRHYPGLLWLKAPGTLAPRDSLRASLPPVASVLTSSRAATAPAPFSPAHGFGWLEADSISRQNLGKPRWESSAESTSWAKSFCRLASRHPGGLKGRGTLGDGGRRKHRRPSGRGAQRGSREQRERDLGRRAVRAAKRLDVASGETASSESSGALESTASGLSRWHTYANPQETPDFQIQ
jgi:hypothetical protein